MMVAMVVDRIPCSFGGRDGCNNGGAKKYLIDHLGSHHFSFDESKCHLKDHIASDPCLFFSLHVALKKKLVFGFVVSVCAPTPSVRIVDISMAL